ncbi:rRNA pseudouridine synthase [Candidatus Woesearchaeota archaeon]|nr:rRNA pseudouridine synthase [Candidatus Woesearchaeota archaeon]
MLRVQKIIADAGICSRRKAEQLIKDEKVFVNMKIATIGDSADPEKDEIIVDGNKLEPEKKVYLMLNKPPGFITTSTDPWGRKSVLELVHVQQRVFSVGRLDKDTTGLIFLTNDGAWANRIMHPRYEVTKVYEAELDKPFQDKDLDRLNKGVMLDRKLIKAKARRLTKKKVQVTVHTGLNKEIKRLFKTLDYWVRGLKRVQIGQVRLDVKPGKTRHLVESEIEKFR